MPTSIQVLFFVTYTAIAIGVAFFSVTVSAAYYRTLDRRHASLVWLTGLLIVPVGLASALGCLPGRGFLLPLAPLLPLACISAAVANTASLRGHDLGPKILHVPVIAWNLALAALYTLRTLAVLFHVDVGLTGQGLLCAFAITQQNIGWQEADALPIFVYLPILLPPLTPVGRLPFAFAGIGGFVSTFLIGLFATAVPEGLSITRIKRKVPVARELSPRGDIRVSMGFGDGWERRAAALPSWLAFLGDAATLDLRIERAVGLGLTEVELRTEPGVSKDPDRLAALLEAAKRVREAGLGLIVRVTPPRAWRGSERPNRAQFLAQMREEHWIVAERVKPDLLVLFERPFGPVIRGVLGRTPAKHWERMILESTRELKKGVPGQRTAVDLTPPAMEARELFAKLSVAPDGPDEIRFVLDGNRAESKPLTRALLELQSWLATFPTERSIGLKASPPSPLSLGGPVAQRSYMRRIIMFANGQPLVARLGVGPMVDSDRALNGYWDSRDVERACVVELRERLHEMNGHTRRAAAPPRGR